MIRDELRPASQGRPAEADGGIGAGETGGAVTVLVVDDEVALTETYAAHLVDAYEVVTANSGRAALAAAGDADAILLDRGMPERSGDEVLAALRERGVRAPVAMVTGVEPTTDVARLPFDEYVRKPVRRDDLRGVVESLLVVSTYDERVRRYFSLAARRAAIEAGADDGSLDGDETYARLVERVERAAADADRALDDGGTPWRMVE